MIKLISPNKLKNIEEEKFSIVFVNKNYKKQIKRIKETIKEINKNYIENIYLINIENIKEEEKKEYKDIKVFPSIFFYKKNKDYPEYFIEGLLDKEKIKEKIKGI